MGTTGAAIYNPATNLPSIVDANELSYVATTVNGATTAGTSTIVVASAAGLAIDQFIQADANGVNAEILQITNLVTNTISVWPPTAHNHANGAPVTCKVARQIVSFGDPTNPAYQAGVDPAGNIKVNVIAGSMTGIRLSASFLRPANTTVYTPGALVANSTTAGSVVPLAFANAVPLAGNAMQITRVRLMASSAVIVSASFLVHLFEANPTVTVGDGGAFDVAGVLATSGMLYYVGAVPIDILQAGSDGAIGFGSTGALQGLTLAPVATTVYALIEATAAYPPTSGQSLTVILEGNN